MTASCVIGTRAHVKRYAPSRIGVDPEKVSAFLRAKYPANTAASVAADTGIPTRTVQSYFGSTPATPSADSFLRLIFAYGPDFLAALFPDAPAWLDSAKAEERRKALEAKREAIDEELAALRGRDDA